MEFDSPYLTQQIIAYIGNKRKLLSLIYKALESSGVDMNAPLRFADLFSGSGVVSRFAKQLGFEVYCNDWEPYAEILSQGFVGLDKSEFASLFPDFDSFLQKLESLPSPDADSGDSYFSKYYGAHSDDVNAADFRTERLFYTHQNALAIDTIRSYIEREFPNFADKRRHILIALLLYEAATHTNTSGVFKAFHKGFGGHGKDALNRILGAIRLHEPVLIDRKAPVHIYRKDANELVRTLPEMDVVYLDPPYNQHQYGSNYHILNSIALWDKIPAPLELDTDGILVNKAAIRADWVQTRSDYCYKKTASQAFRDLLSHIRSKLILVSYSSDGIIPFEEMKAVCMSKGAVSIVTSDYTVYRGGKQSNSRKSTDIEYVLVIDTSRKADTSASEEIDHVILERKLRLLLKRRFNREKLSAAMKAVTDKASGQICYSVPLAGKQTECFICSDGLTLSLAVDFLPEKCTLQELRTLCQFLEQCSCQNKQEELYALLTLTKKAAASGDERNAARYARQIPATLKKLAQKKYRAAYYTVLSMIHSLSESTPAQYMLIKEKVDEIAATAELRFKS
ncbi:MAG: DNA adenine methylase [Treponema sp.]|nr:DNA adenine methylase [Treponema sp.]